MHDGFGYSNRNKGYSDCLYIKIKALVMINVYYITISDWHNDTVIVIIGYGRKLMIIVSFSCLVELKKSKLKSQKETERKREKSRERQIQRETETEKKKKTKRLREWEKAEENKLQRDRYIDKEKGKSSRVVTTSEFTFTLIHALTTRCH